MIYRYRLKENKENENLNSRQIEGITLYKKRWLYKNSPLNFDRYINLIDFESAESDAQFLANEEKLKQEEVARKRLLVKSNINNKKESKKDYSKLSKKELLEQCKLKGFKDNEIKGYTKIELIKLLVLDEEL